MIRFARAPLPVTLDREGLPSPAPRPVPDPFDDPDALDDLGDEIATLAAHIHAATQRLLQLLADFDHRRGWELGGHSSCAHWLALRTGIDLGAAREKVRTARTLAGLPLISASMARGELSFSVVRALHPRGHERERRGAARLRPGMHDGPDRTDGSWLEAREPPR